MEKISWNKEHEELVLSFNWFYHSTGDLEFLKSKWYPLCTAGLKRPESPIFQTLLQWINHRGDFKKRNLVEGGADCSDSTSKQRNQSDHRREIKYARQASRSSLVEIKSGRGQVWSGLVMPPDNDACGGATGSFARLGRSGGTEKGRRDATSGVLPRNSPRPPLPPLLTLHPSPFASCAFPTWVADWPQQVCFWSLYNCTRHLDMCVAVAWLYLFNVISVDGGLVEAFTEGFKNTPPPFNGWRLVKNLTDFRSHSLNHIFLLKLETNW